ncbi:MAG: EF-hand domain-containing protein [Akkermansiaceae bacterium]|jgi:hypothetical protein|nr:EF-hand domain-containing protein [Akkermansiaceae bacterium]
MKNSINLIALIGIFTALLTAPLFAADDEKKKPAKKPTKTAAERFAKFDKNSDGSLSLDELKANPYFKDKPEVAAKNFKRRDKDGDGKLSKEEFAAKQQPKKKKGDAAKKKGDGAKKKGDGAKKKGDAAKKDGDGAKK